MVSWIISSATYPPLEMMNLISLSVSQSPSNYTLGARNDALMKVPRCPVRFHFEVDGI